MLSGDNYYKCKYIAIRTGIIPKERLVYNAAFNDH